MSVTGTYTIERVRGDLGDQARDEILAFWKSHAALDGEAAARRLPEVVCVVRDAAGEIAGVNSAYADEVPLISGRRFWVYRSLLRSDATEEEQAMIAAAYTILNEEFEQTPEAALGLLVGMPDPPGRERLAEWSDPKFVFAGWAGDARVWISYFDGAKIGPGNAEVPEAVRELAPGYTVRPMAEQEEVTGDEVIELWRSKANLSQEEADRRLGQVLLVVTDSGGALVGVTTAYLGAVPQLGIDLWHVRGFVASGHRETANIGVALAKDSIDHLDRRFGSGEDTRAPGMVFVVENPGLQQYFNDGHWVPPSKVTFIGENRRGAHVRVRYFRGANAPSARPA